MNITDLLNGPMGSVLMKSVANQVGLTEKQTSTALNNTIPLILGGIEKNVKTSKGAESLQAALESKHDGSLLDGLGGLLSGGNFNALLQDGGGIANHVFGANLGAVQKGIAEKSGISIDKASTIIKIAAPIVMAYLGKEKKSKGLNSGDLGQLLGGLLGGGASSNKSSAGGLIGMVTGMLGKDKGGNPLDDLLGMFTKK